MTVILDQGTHFWAAVAAATVIFALYAWKPAAWPVSIAVIFLLPLWGYFFPQDDGQGGNRMRPELFLDILRNPFIYVAFAVMWASDVAVGRLKKFTLAQSFGIRIAAMSMLVPTLPVLFVFGLLYQMEYHLLYPKLFIGGTAMAVAMGVLSLKWLLAKHEAKEVKSADAPILRAFDWRHALMCVSALFLAFALAMAEVNYEVSQWFLHQHPQVAILSVFAATALAANLINGSVAAIVFGPVALAIAAAVKADPYAFALCVAAAANASFISARLKMNRLVLAFSGISESDFTKSGSILVIIALLAYPVIAIKVFGL